MAQMTMSLSSKNNALNPSPSTNNSNKNLCVQRSTWFFLLYFTVKLEKQLNKFQLFNTEYKCSAGLSQLMMSLSTQFPKQSKKMQSLLQLSSLMAPPLNLPSNGWSQGHQNASWISPFFPVPTSGLVI
jgi:hypothetical protein